jgi:exonuclease VII small subunit
MALRARAEKADRAALPAEEAAGAEPQLSLGRGVRSVATAGDVGEFFQYAIGTPVTLPRRQSAMLPIVTGEVKTEKLSIYNPRVHAKHPLNGLRLTNSTDLHLMQGPITVFDGGAYAGDAKIEDLPPKSERLVSYAMDLDTEVAPESKGAPQQLLSVRISKGTLFIEQKQTRTQEYTVKNSGRKAKKVLIEQPFDPTWTLVEPKEPAEKTRDLYRFAVAAKPGEPAKLAVVEERIDRQQVALTNLDDNMIVMYRSAKVVSDKVKAALAEVVKRRHEMAQVAAKRTQLEQQIQAIEQEQARIRQNMGQLDRAGDLYKRYVKKFSDQEDEIEKLRAGVKEQRDQEAQLRKALDEYLMGLEME